MKRKFPLCLMIVSALLLLSLLGGCRGQRREEDAGPDTTDPPVILEEPVTGTDEVIVHEDGRSAALDPDMQGEIEEE